jgi:hypothetical protein
MPDNDPGLPISYYLTVPGCGVLFNCESCQASTRAELEDVIAKLKATGKGDEETGIRALRWLTDRPCKRCGKATWETRPAFPKP